MTYLYRDAGNYKHWQDAIFPNRDNKSAVELTAKIRKHLISGQYFEAELAPIPIETENEYDGELDHSWLEFHSLEEVENTAQMKSDITEFIFSLNRGYQ